MSHFKVALVGLNNQTVPDWVSEPLGQAGIEFVAHHTPHIGGYSDESGDLFWRLSLETVLDLAQGRWPRSYVNRGVKPRWKLT